MGNIRSNQAVRNTAERSQMGLRRLGEAYAQQLSLLMIGALQIPVECEYLAQESQNPEPEPDQQCLRVPLETTSGNARGFVEVCEPLASRIVLVLLGTPSASKGPECPCTWTDLEILLFSSFLENLVDGCRDVWNRNDGPPFKINGNLTACNGTETESETLEDQIVVRFKVTCPDMTGWLLFSLPWRAWAAEIGDTARSTDPVSRPNSEWARGALGAISGAPVKVNAELRGSSISTKELTSLEEGIILLFEDPPPKAQLSVNEHPLFEAALEASSHGRRALRIHSAAIC